MDLRERVENSCPALLLPNAQGLLGLTTLSQYIYVFYPEKIRVYEQLPARPSPELVEEIYLSKKNICRFAVSNEYIAVLFEDSGLEVRLREYWEVVQYSSPLQETADTIDSLEIDANKVYYRFKKESEEHPTFGFIDLSEKAQQIQYWQQTKPLQKLIHRHRLGSIPDFYVSLIESQIKFGMYYQEQPTLLKEFEFGTLKELQPDVRVLSVHLLECQEIRKEEQLEKKDLYLVKLVEEQGKKEKEGPKKKHKNKQKCNSSSVKSRLLLKYIRFFQEEVPDSSEEDPTAFSHDHDKKFKVFEKMLNSMQQIQANTNCEKSDFFGNSAASSEQQLAEQNSPLQADQWREIELPILAHEMEFLNILKKGSILYIYTNDQIFSFSFEPDAVLARKKELIRESAYYKIEDVCQHGLVLEGRALFAMPFEGIEAASSGLVKKQHKEPGQFVRESSGSSSYSKNEVQGVERTVEKPKAEITSRDMQTEASTDVFLEQFDEKQLKQIIDELFEKKKVTEEATQTARAETDSQEIQTDSQEIQTEQTRCEPGHLAEEPVSESERLPPAEPTEVETNEQATQFQQSRPELLEKGVGECLPLCPECHHCSLNAISKSLKKIEENSGANWTHLATDALKSEQQRIKNEVLLRIKEIVHSVVGEKVVPLVEDGVRSILDQKLAEVNSYIYSLAMANLINLNHELEKDVARENAIRNELMKKQMHEMAESKKSVAQMIEVCKAREIQKIAFFQSIAHKFTHIQGRVADLEEKITLLTKAETEKDAELGEQIEAIRTLLQEEGQARSRSRSRSDEQMEQSEEVEEEIESSEEASSEEDKMDTYALHQQREMMAMQTRLLSMPYAPPAPALQCWPQPPPYYPGYSPYPYPGYYPQYPPMQMMPPQPPMRKPLKKTRLAQPEQEAMAEFGKLKKKQKGR